MNNLFNYNTIIGEINIVDNGSSIVEVFKSKKNIDLNLYRKTETDLIKETHRQLLEYLEGKRRKFDIPLHLEGTDFQKNVWKALLDIKYGESKSYKDIAREIGNPKGYRAVGAANGKNPILIVIPCHRVIGADGKLGGYSSGLDLKRKLLKLEKIKYKE